MRRKITGYKLFCIFMITLCILGIPSQSIYSDTNGHGILILNSYHKGLAWTDEETEGIINILHSYDADCKISVEYMDWKNYPTQENLDNLYNHFTYKYKNKRNDVVIAVDDAALDFAVQHREGLFDGAPIVFCGVNAKGIDKIRDGNPRITGVTEIPDPEKTVQAALAINPNLSEIYVLFDNSESGKSTGEMTVQAIKSIAPSVKINTLSGKSFEEILAAVASAPENSIVLITTYYMDPYGEVVGFEDFSRKVSKNSKVPIYHLYEFGIGNGAMGGSMLSGRLQGKHAGEIAARILQGEDITDIPIETAKTTRIIFDYMQLERFGVDIDQLPKNSQIINKPISIFDEYKSLVITAIIIFSMLIMFIITLVIYLTKMSRMKLELEEHHSELKISDDKLRKQYQDLMEAQQQLIISENRYALLFEKMLNGFFIFEPVLNEEGILVDICLLSVNPGFKVEIEVDTDEIVGKSWTEIFKYPNKNLHVYREVLQTGEGRHFETHYANTGQYYLVNAFKIADNQVGVVFDNITVYKQAIKEITMLNEDLEQRVLDRTEELQSVVKELEAFTYTVSHDLKSPLRAVDGYSRIIQEDFGPQLGTDGNEMICNIRNICKDMIEMINQLLKYSTTSKAEIIKEEINIEEKIKAIFSELKSVYPDRDIRLMFDTNMPMVFADRIMMRQVIYNILSNAVKFTKHKAIALIHVGCTTVGDEYQFYIKDNGVGFDMEYSNKLFGIFQRLHTNDEFEGSGIGLATVHKIIQRHGGQVHIEGEPAVGTTVYFTLPLRSKTMIM